jgi:hypothetical protein
MYLGARPVPAASGNFSFLDAHGAQLYRFAALAEHYFQNDPNTCLFKLRQLTELLAQDVAARASLFTSTEEPLPAALLLNSQVLLGTKSERQAIRPN